MAGTDKLVEVTTALKAVLEDAPVDFKDIWIGDETLIPRTPAASILGGPKSRELVETGFTTRNTFDATIVIYHAKLASQNINRLDCTEFAETIEDHLHVDKTLGGLLYVSYCTSIEPGFSEQGQAIMVSTRISWQGRSKTRI